MMRAGTKKKKKGRHHVIESFRWLFRVFFWSLYPPLSCFSLHSHPFSMHACVSLVNHPLCVKVSVSSSLSAGSSVLPLSFHNYVRAYPCPTFLVSCFWFLVPRYFWPVPCFAFALGFLLFCCLHFGCLLLILFSVLDFWTISFHLPASVSAFGSPFV